MKSSNNIFRSQYSDCFQDHRFSSLFSTSKKTKKKLQRKWRKVIVVFVLFVDSLRHFRILFTIFFVLLFYIVLFYYIVQFICCRVYKVVYFAEIQNWKREKNREKNSYEKKEKKRNNTIFMMGFDGKNFVFLIRNDIYNIILIIK